MNYRDFTSELNFNPFIHTEKNKTRKSNIFYVDKSTSTNDIGSHEINKFQKNFTIAEFLKETNKFKKLDCI